MSKPSLALASLPPDAARALASLGEHLALARVRRNESQRIWAQRIGVSVPTLIRMERGDASVGMGVYAKALWKIGLVGKLGEIARPEHDLRALETEVRAIKRKRAARKQPSLAERLANDGARGKP